MLTIRLQRTGRTGHAQFRVIVQDSRAHPKSGRVVAYVGNYNPHSKAATIDKEKISSYLTNGAVPSDRVARLLTKEGMKLPDWYKAPAPKEKAVRNPDKRRSTRPAEAVSPEAPPAAEEAQSELAEPTETPAPEAAEAPAETEQPETKNEAPAEEPKPGATNETTGKSTEKPAEEPAGEQKDAE